MDDANLARAVHVLGIVLWIGGVGFVTTVLLPSIRRMKNASERVTFFDEIERRFAWQARGTTLLVGLSGFYLVHTGGFWDRFSQSEFWWMHAMVIIWAVFSILLFVAEPLFLHRWLSARAAKGPEQTFRLIQRFHWVLLILSVVTVVGAAAGSHGW
ncbi:MAG: hypothetical protein O3B21_07740 [Proteobacteria bacterium]|nr:hypothetical protein [Pseudomonadota bacterium]MDA1357119.1 hypothetical protein [Pseudomonadota bacterium]